MDFACRMQERAVLCALRWSAAKAAPRSSAWPRAAMAAALALAVLLSASPAPAETPAGDTSRQSRDDSLRNIPFQKLTEPARQKIAYVVSNPSMFRRMPAKVIDCDPEMYLFLVRYPEVVVNIWDMMGVTSVTMNRSGPFTFSAADGLGTASDVELVYGDSTTHLLYADGAYDGKGPLMRNPVKGRCVMLLRSNFHTTAEGRSRVTSQLDVFVRIESAGIDLLAKTLHPLVGRTADLNFLESTKFLGRLSDAAEINGAGVQELAGRLEKVHPEVRERFAEVAGNVHQRAMLRLAKQSPEVVVAPTAAAAVPEAVLHVANRTASDESASSDMAPTEPTEAAP